MEVSFLDLKEKEIVNVYDGRKLGHLIDVVFDVSNGYVLGIIAPGNKKIFRKSEDIFIPINKIKRIGGDVILVGIQLEFNYSKTRKAEVSQNLKSYENYYSPINNNERQFGDYRNINRYNSDSQKAKNYNFNQREFNKSNMESFVRYKPMKINYYK